MSTPLEDGLSTLPLYAAEDSVADTGVPGFAPFVRGGRAEVNTLAGWDVRQRHTAPDNGAVLTDPQNGVTSLWLEVGAEEIAVTSLDRVLERVYLDLAPVVLNAKANTVSAAGRLLRLYEERGVDKASARGNLGADPVGHEARTGEALAFAPLADLVRQCADEYPGLRVLTVDALPYHEAGGSAAQELGCPGPPSRSSSGPRDGARASWSPKWARTTTTAARRSSRPPSPTWASTSTSARDAA